MDVLIAFALMALLFVLLGSGLWIGLSLLGAAAAPFAVHSDAISRSDDVRIDVRHQLSAYLDMVTMLLAATRDTRAHSSRLPVPETVSCSSNSGDGCVR